MFKKTIATITTEIAKIFVHVDPAPLPDDGLKNVAKALKEDIKSLTKKSEKGK